MQTQVKKLSEHWEGDQLGRKQVAANLEKYLTNRYHAKPTESGFVLAVNAEWGFGKTFMLQCWRDELESKNYPVVYFDAWKNDFTPEPLIAFISEIDNGLKPSFTKIPAAKRALNGAMGKVKKLIKPSIQIIGMALLKQIAGLSAEKIHDLFSDGDADEVDIETDSITKHASLESTTKALEKMVAESLKEHKTTKAAIEEFKGKLTLLIDALEMSTGVELPIFILVDELDRCRPDYAIELLEGIKHLFGVKGIYFVVATNIDQLSESVKAVYGAGFDGARYLKRFFDLEYTLPEPDRFAFAKHLFSGIQCPESSLLYTGLNSQSLSVDSNDILPMLFKHYSDYFECGLRDQIQIIKIIESAFIYLQHNQINIHLLLFFAMLYHRSSTIFNSVTEYGNLSDRTGFQTLKLNPAIGSFSIEMYDSHLGRGFSPAKKYVSIPEIATIFLGVKDETTEEALGLNNIRSDDFPKNLIRCLFHGATAGSESIWKQNIDKYVDIVRFSGGFN